MSTPLLHRRLSILLALSGLGALMVGGGAPSASAGVAAAVLLGSLRWRTGPRWGHRLERLALPLAAILLLRATYHIAVLGQDAVFPVVDLLLLLLAVEAVRPLEADNEVRLHALAFALLLAGTAYRPGILFALCFLAFLLLGIPALALGHVRETDDRQPLPRRMTPTGGLSVLGTRPLGALMLITLVFSGGIFLAFPRLSSGWMGFPDGPSVPMAGFGDPVTLGSLGTRILPNPQVIFRVQFPQGDRPATPLYWRGRSYDRFDGLRWSRSADLPPALAPGEWAKSRWPGPEVAQTIRWAGAMDTFILFSLHPVLSAQVDGPVPPFLDGSGDLVMFGRRPAEIRVLSRPTLPSPRQLRDADSGFIPASEYFLQLPPLPTEVVQLALQVVGEARSRYDRVTALERWFHEEFQYTLELPASPREATVPHFLLERREGHCEYFASGMVVLLRTLGIQARLVNGFLGGQWNDTGGFLAVSGNQAHAWVEVWFPGYGWIPFDSTPPGTGAQGPLPSMSPFQLVMDGLRFRWNRWVLEFGQEDQLSFLDGVAQRFSTGGEGEEGGREPEDGALKWLGLAGLVALVLGFGVRRLQTRRLGGSTDPAVRSYLRLRRLYSPLGVEGPERLPPLAFLRELESRRLPGAAESREVVEVYLAHRFQGSPLAAGHRQALQDGVRRVRRELSGGG
ncbi:MAG: transglutaminase domain-containing protein [Gemmatimonadota bacterium]